jgi:poly-gamma-glutamate capsule biosynthesis protein CapA/YwtB (metallophosphatase superfamily)
VVNESPEPKKHGDILQDARQRIGRALDRTSYRQVAGIAVIVIAVLAFCLAIANFFYAQAAHSNILASKPYTVQIAQAASADMKPIVESYINTKASGRLVLTQERGADVFIGDKALSGYEAARVTGMPAQTLTAGTVSKVLRPAREYWYCYKRTGILLKQKDPDVESLEHYIDGYYDSADPVVFTAVGDIIPARHVAEAMAKYGTDFAFKTALPLVKGSDITAGDLECPLTDRVKAPYSGMTFAAPTKTIGGLKLLGLDVVTLANNHSTNFGRGAFADTLKTLKSGGIAYAGGGYDYDEAHSPGTYGAKGLKFAFLSYNSIEGSLDASSSEAGVSWIRMPPFSPDSPEDVRKVEDDIKKAKQQADFVVACFHWSKEYQYHPNPSMVALAHRACDAGADMVLGQHPHTIQSVEYYKGKLIAYSLGNFIFDQRRVEIEGKQVGEQTRKGYVLRSEFRRGFLLDFDLLPYRINDACQTIPLSGKPAQAVLDKLFEISGWKTEGATI